MQQLEGSIISRYRIQKQTAAGGLTKSYTAVDRRTGQLVVMKLIHYSDNEHVERLQRTIQIVSELKHEHILPILDHGQHDLWYYLVTPFSEDETLEQQFSKGPFSLEDAGHILLQLADALQFAHRHGISYRNVQPCNILLKDGSHIYLMDASLSHDLQDEQSSVETTDADATGTALSEMDGMEGTSGQGRATAPPEQGVAPTISSIPDGAGTDVIPEPPDEQATLATNTYALGIMLYQMLTGGSPGGHPDHAEEVEATGGGQPRPYRLNRVDMQSQQTTDPLLSLSKLDRSVPEAMREVILRALAPDLQARFQTPLEFAQAYQDVLAQFTSPTTPVAASNKLKDLAIPLVRLLPPQKVSLIQKLIQKYRGERLLVGVIASAVILILASLFIEGVSFFDAHQQVAQQNHQPGQASQPSRGSGTVSSSPTISPTANNTTPKKQHLKRARPNNGPTYGTQPTVQPIMQPYPTYQPTVQSSPTVQVTVQSSPAVQATVQSTPTVQPTVQPPTPTPTPSPVTAPGNHGNGKGKGKNAAPAQSNAS